MIPIIANLLALKALRKVEWVQTPSAISPVCPWCGGYQCQPVMDEDYYEQLGHKPNCLRQSAVTALEATFGIPHAVKNDTPSDI